MQGECCVRCCFDGGIFRAPRRKTQVPSLPTAPASGFCHSLITCRAGTFTANPPSPAPPGRRDAGSPRTRDISTQAWMLPSGMSPFL